MPGAVLRDVPHPDHLNIPEAGGKNFYESLTGRTSKKLAICSPHLHPTTVVLVHIFDFSTFDEDLISVQLISFNDAPIICKEFIQRLKPEGKRQQGE